MIWGICANSHDVIETSPNAVDIRLCQLGTHVLSRMETATRICDCGSQCAGREGSSDVDMVAARDRGWGSKEIKGEEFRGGN